MVTVKVFDDERIDKLIKESPKSLRDYIKELRHCLSEQQTLTAKAIVKLKEQARSLAKLFKILEDVYGKDSVTLKIIRERFEEGNY